MSRVSRTTVRALTFVAGAALIVAAPLNAHAQPDVDAAVAAVRAKAAGR